MGAKKRKEKNVISSFGRKNKDEKNSPLNFVVFPSPWEITLLGHKYIKKA